MLFLWRNENSQDKDGDAGNDDDHTGLREKILNIFKNFRFFSSEVSEKLA